MLPTMLLEPSDLVPCERCGAPVQGVLFRTATRDLGPQWFEVTALDEGETIVVHHDAARCLSMHDREPPGAPKLRVVPRGSDTDGEGT